MKSRDNELIILYLIIDLVLLNYAILLAAWLSPEIRANNYENLGVYLVTGNISWVISYSIFSKRNLHLRDGYYNRFMRITKRTLVFLVVLAVITFLLMPANFSRTFFIEYTFIFYIAKLIAYCLLYNYLRYNRERGAHVQRILMVGVNKTNQFLRKIIDVNPILGYHFVGYVGPEKSDYLEILGTPEELEELIEIHHIQTVFVSIPVPDNAHTEKHYLRLCDQLGVRLRFVPENQRWHHKNLNLESVGDIVLINPQEIPLDNLISRTWKRLFDILFSTLFLVLIFSWLYPILAVIIKLSSKGPVFFVQKRTGYNNRTFKCYKFRSMRVNHLADEVQASANDSRITKIGRFMRRTNLDELPQFINVWFGQMSVVGPRPHMLKHTEEYSALIENYLKRHHVKPGVTGWAQVNGFRGETDELWKMEKRIEFDKEYIENWNFWWDMRIIWMTTFHIKSYRNAV